MEHLGYLQALLLGLAALIVAFAGFARRFAISYPIVLVIAGLLCSLLPQVPSVPLAPDLVFLVFLPPLLYAAAWQTSWREFQYNLVSISLLAFGLVFFTACGVALTAHFFLPGFDWRLGFLLGAVVSPTDAVAASSIARHVGMPQRIVDVLEGESLLNDATGLLALQFGVDMIIQGATPRLGPSVWQFTWLLAGGAGIGLLVALLVTWADRWIDDGPVEIVLSFVVAYVSYLAGEAVHASGVIATVACGLYLSRKSSTSFSPAVRLQAEGVWDAAEFLLNGLVFVLIGLQLPYVLQGLHGYGVGRLVLYGGAFSATLIALRMVWMYPGAHIAHLFRTRVLHQAYDMPSPKAIFVLGWTGMRGVVALAAASSLPYTLQDGRPFPQRNIILFLTFAVILVTLVVQGTSLPLLVRTLNLNESTGQTTEERKARQILLRGALDLLFQSRVDAGKAEAHAYSDLIHHYEHQLREVEDADPETASAERDRGERFRELQLVVVQHERKELLRLRNDGQIGDGTRRVLERELDLQESRLLT